MKSVVRQYYDSVGIDVSGPLHDAIIERNDRALRYVRYAIQNLATVPGVEHALRQIAQIARRTGESGADQLDAKIQYYSQLVEFHATQFVHQTLGLAVLAVEAPGTPILSPRRTSSEKSCDILARDDSSDLYFEVKSSNAELRSEREWRGRVVFDPLDGEPLEKWIVQKSRDADKKGADYLIVQIPVWVDDAWKSEKHFYSDWVGKIFPVIRKIDRHEWLVEFRRECASIRGIYILKSFGHLLLRFAG